MTLNGSTHEELKELIAEEALGILDGRERSRLLAHVETCPACAQELESLSRTADALAKAAPRREPPIGFEARTLARIETSPLRRDGPARRARLLVAAVSLAGAFGLGWLGSTFASSPSGARVALGHLSERPLLAAGRDVGTAYVYTGRPAWMFVTVAMPGDPPAVKCTLVTTSGDRRDVGTFTLSAGKGEWEVGLPVPATAIRGIELTASRVEPMPLGSTWGATRAPRPVVAIYEPI